MNWHPQKSLLKNQPQQRSLLKNWPLQRSLLLNQPLQWPMSGSQLRSQTPPMQCKKTEKKEVPCSSFLGSMQVLHPTQPVTPAGLIPPTLGELRQHHHCHSSGGRRARCWQAKECKRVVGEESNLTSSWGSPEPRPELAPPPDFKGVVACLMRDSPSPAPMKVPSETRPPDVMVGLAWQLCMPLRSCKMMPLGLLHGHC